MQHEKMQHPDTSGGHKHETADKQAGEKNAPDKTPLPDTLEGTWKAIHQNHGELEAAVNAKKFSDVQSHAQGLSELLKRLVKLSHPDHKAAVESGVKAVAQPLAEIKQSAETGSELMLKNNFDAFLKSLTQLEQQMKNQ